jgi:hypothetical protein
MSPLALVREHIIAGMCRREPSLNADNRLESGKTSKANARRRLATKNSP